MLGKTMQGKLSIVDLNKTNPIKSVYSLIFFLDLCADIKHLSVFAMQF